VSDSPKQLERIGYVIGEASPSHFYFLADEGIHPPRWEYVVVKSKELVNGQEIEAFIVAQIYEIVSLSLALDLSNKPSLEAVERLIKAQLVDKRLIAKARVLGFVHGGEILQPRRAIHPGNVVYRAPSYILKEFYSYPDEEGLSIGYLITRPDVPVSISIKGFRRHIAILAQTGAGKSYAAGILLEELLKKGATVIVLDPHADYVFISRKKDGKKFTDRVTVFRTRESTGRYTKEQIGRVETYEIKFSDLTIEEIATVCGISERWTNIINAIEKALDELKENNMDYNLEDLIKKLSDSNDKYNLAALKYIKRLRKLKVFGDTTTDTKKLLKLKHISVVDLSGLDDEVADYITYRILSDIFEIVRAQQYNYPVFIFIEEAHRFIPNKESTLSKRIIKRIAAEGRKFGLFLTIITQRPYKIDPDVLSQCNSQIILRMTNPEDQDAVRKSSERISEDLLRDLPGLNIGEAIIVGEITKAPVMVKIRRRETEEGGADIDIISKLKESTKEAEEEEESLMKRLNEEKELIKNILDGD